MKTSSSNLLHKRSQVFTLQWLINAISLAACTCTATDIRQKLYTYEGSSLTVVYSISHQRLVSKENAWNPGATPFPMDLHTCTLTAREFLETNRQTRGPLSLLNVQLRWISVLVDRDRLAFEDRCFLILMFSSRTPEGKWVGGEELSVVMLLDGTIADAEVTRGSLVYPIRKDVLPKKESGRAQ